MSVVEYRKRARVVAEKVAESGPVSTANGAGYALEGDYLVYAITGVIVVNGAEFEREYEEIQGDNDFHPAGKTVEVVLNFLREYPDEIDRVKEEEKSGAERKGILEYEK